MKWDAESVAIQSASAEAQAQPSNSASDANSVSDTELYDLESLMKSQSGGSVDNELPDMDGLRAEQTLLHSWIIHLLVLHRIL